MNNNIYLGNELPKLLTEEEIKKYFLLMNNGNKEIRRKLIEHNLRLVIYIVNKKFSSIIGKFDINDLISVGSIGLIKAVNKFDINRNIKFSTYASKCIINEILMFLRKSKNQLDVVSLNTSIDNDKDNNTISLLDVISSDDNTEDSYIKVETYGEIRQALDILSDLERKVIILFYMNSLSQKQIAKYLGCSGSNISKADKRARRKIGEYLKSRGLQVNQKIIDEIEQFNNMNADEKITFLARIIVESNISIKKLSERFNVGTHYIKDNISRRLPFIDMLLYQKAMTVLQEQEDEKIYQRIRKIV